LRVRCRALKGAVAGKLQGAHAGALAGGALAGGALAAQGDHLGGRMETVDEEFTAAALDFMDREHKAGKPFFCYFNSTRMHIWTHLKKESEGKTGLGLEADGMVEHDGMVGQSLKKLDDLGIADNTIVVYTTDNGAEMMTWPDGGSTPFRGEKATNWEGLSRADSDSLAWGDQARHDLQRPVRARGLSADLLRRGGRPGCGGQVPQRLSGGSKFRLDA
jgi:hypothetical protein